jgi:DNA topoisomerase VI subunit B
MQNSVLNHVTENFGMFGFGASNSAVLQTCKELIDNSVAACSYSTCQKPQIIVSLNQDRQHDELLVVEIIDNGCGIADLDGVLSFFSSGHGGSSVEESSQPQIKGKFGVGLTTCLLYSQLETSMPIRYDAFIDVSITVTGTVL